MVEHYTKHQFWELNFANIENMLRKMLQIIKINFSE